MNLVKLFDMQRQLDAHIEKEHPRQEGEDRLAKKILALQVELGELANENRCFKYWSNDQKPRTNHRFSHMDTGRHEHGSWSVPVYKDGQLEEYVDCLHFILSIGLELGIKNIPVGNVPRYQTLTEGFLDLFKQVSVLATIPKEDVKVQRVHYSILLDMFVDLGEMLGYTWEQIEEAYMQKNAENHARQERGY